MKTRYRLPLSLFLLAGILSVFSAAAQENQAYQLPGTGTFLLHGKASHIPENEKSFRLAICNPFDNQLQEITFEKDGSFRKEIPVTGTQDIYLYLNDAVTLFSYPGDTIELTFDYQDCPASVHVAGNTEKRTRELQLSLELYKKHRKAFLDLGNISRRYRKITLETDTPLLNAIHRYITDYRNTIQTYTAQQGAVDHEAYLLQRGYFSGISFVSYSPEALQKLFYSSLETRCYSGEQKEEKPLYSSPSFNPFLSTAATDFMWRYLSANLNRAVSLTGKQNQGDLFPDVVKIAGVIITNKELHDWYLATSFKRGLNWFNWKPTEELKETGEHLLASVTAGETKQCIRETLEHHFKRFAKGADAPSFTLTDEKGKKVSLSDLKGKVAYLDFWADGCAPCLYEFKQQQAFHKKYAPYKDEIVYVYICLGSTDKRWKELVRKYGLEGINLHAASWNDPAVAAYNNNAVPLYVLIDREGKIVEYNTLRPSELIKDEPNLLDETIKKNH